jgi:hypothetical protein
MIEMQQWEYLQVTLNAKQQVEKAVVNGQSLQVPGKGLISGGDLSAFLATLGAEGWELVGTLSGYVPSVLFFKRPRP